MWGYKWGGASRKKFAKKHDILLLYSKTSEYTFNASAVREAYTTKDTKWHNNSHGKIMRDVWDDIPIINTQAKERTGYPTQKPLPLLERVVSASSHVNDSVLDPFCGSGTALVASENLERRWLGMDSNPVAERVVKARLDNVNVVRPTEL